MSQQPPITLSYAREQLQLWQSALTATASGQAYSIGGRSLTRQDNATIRAEIQRWHNAVVSIEAHAAGNVRPLGSTAAFPVPGSGGSGSGVLYPDSIWRDWRT